ncbi:MAG TPA: glutathione S-transferase [Xanthobacteraceae bacterium]|nr:glutathione S-transferase [Xanthobacteraceae bacterium]
MLTLRFSPASPFVRKVRIGAALAGLAREIEIVAAETTDPAEVLRRQNPLGKIPALILEDGTVLYDSRVILEYLDHRAGGGRIVPHDPAARIEALRLQALGDGIMDAGILQIYEQRWRAEERREPRWVEHQAGKVERTLAVLEQAPPPLDQMNVGTIAIACALGYLDFRFGGSWRAGHPRLVQWLDAFAAKVPAFSETKPS